MHNEYYWYSEYCWYSSFGGQEEAEGGAGT